MLRRLAFALPLLVSVHCATIPRNAVPAFAEEVDRILGAQPAGRIVAVSYHDLRSGSTFERNERETFHAASTMKLPVMLGIFEAVSRGELRLDQQVPVRNEFVSIFDGSQYSLESREDSDPELYTRVGTTVTLEELVKRMITRSSNLATNLVIELIGAKRVMALMQRIGATDIQVLRGVEDDKAYRAGMNNTVTAHDLMLIYRALGERRVISPAASEKMIEILAGQEHRDGIPAGLPPGTRVAHKTGWIPSIAHDSALVLTPGGEYALVVLTRGYEKHAEAEGVIAAISRAVWQGR